ncbi:mitochondrial antiviral-signaling protein [Acanthochromis polyacanthus]|uniref:mitochondrial antiviral-signaling protein n=1 Tax=Acanthochromis polyacanthus TaxID=80966 RepID=UPI00223495DD|nr:mitochondrial antiviral-signaling protein [Acanthochromis polyacanthus]
MSFVDDKLYNGYLRRNMPTIVSKVKVREIMVHLPCLTSHDRETIEAKRETSGNFQGMVLLLDCLKRRENWPEQFIEALEACEHTTIAADIRREYNALRGNNSNPSSPPTNVVRAHVHPPPSDSRLPVPETDAAPAASAVVEAPPSPPEPAVQTPPPLETPQQLQVAQTPAPAAAKVVPQAVSPPEPVAEPPQPTQTEVQPPPSTPPPSPVIPHTQVTTPPLQQRDVNSHQEPEENSESDIPDQVSSGNGEVAVDSTITPNRVVQNEADTPSHQDQLQTAAATEETPPWSPSPAQIDSDGSSFLTLTPEKPPVQDTTPPVNVIPATVLQPEETSEPAATQVVEKSPQTETAAPTSPDRVAAAGGVDISLNGDNSVCLSKPGQLVSVQPEHHSSPTAPASVSPYSGNSDRLEVSEATLEPYSGNNDRLDISEAALDAVSSPACSAIQNPVAESPYQENGVALNHNEPEENHYESPSLGVLEHVVQVSEAPSVPNLDGQTSAPQIQINGEAAKEFTSAPPLSTNADTVSGLNAASCEPAAADNSHEKNSDDKATLQANLNQSANTKYILTAVGVGACALLAVWKFKS